MESDIFNLAPNPSDNALPQHTPSIRPWSVSEAAAHIRDALAEGLPTRITIEGEVSNLSDRQHWFFSLKDTQATLKCVCFASAAKKVKFKMRNGMKVIAIGRIDHYDAQGQTQLYVDRLEPAGQGDLEQQLRILIESLREKGWLDPSIKKSLPVFPQRIAIVTSKTGAAIRDFVRIAQQRCPSCELLLCDVRVQGADAAPEIANMIRKLSKQAEALQLDAVVVTRGGGSLEDLWAFNERIVAEAIHECMLPVVAAIGHEVDVTVAELVADVRCATPSHAAETLLPETRVLKHQLQQIQHRLRLDISRRLRHEIIRLQAATRHPFVRQPARQVKHARKAIQQYAFRLSRCLPLRWQAEQSQLLHFAKQLRRQMQGLTETPRQNLQRLESQTHQLIHRHLQQKHSELARYTQRLHSIHPHRVLDRGYSYTLNEQGQVVSDARGVKVGERIYTVLAKGKIHSQVLGQVDESNAIHTAQPHSAKKSQKTKRKPKGNIMDDTPGLFD